MPASYVDTREGRRGFIEDIANPIAEAYSRGGIQELPVGESVAFVTFAFARHENMAVKDAVQDTIKFCDELDNRIRDYDVAVVRSDVIHQVSHGILGDIIKLNIVRRV